MTLGLSVAALATSFLAGMVSFLSPCVLPLVPGYVSYVAGRSLDARGGGRGAFSAFGSSLLFVLGFSSVFVALGASATALGATLLAHRYAANLIGGAVVILFGCLMLGVLRAGVLQRDVRWHPHLPAGQPAAAYVLGAAFAFGWTPCIGPVLGAILTASAVTATVGQGVVLLGVYSLGLGVPFLLAAMFTSRLVGRLRSLGRIGRALQLGAGAIVIAMGLAMMTGELSTLSYWLLDSFPVFSKIG
ncbi:MAG: cytochrome c biogenesis CcdA family protein [Stellaceae bacterium]